MIMRWETATTWKASGISMRRPPRMFLTTRPMELETSLTILQNLAACLLHHDSCARISFLSSFLFHASPLPPVIPHHWIQIPKIPSNMPSPENEKVHPQITGFGCKPATRAALKSVACAVFDMSAVRRIRFSDGRDGKKKRKTKQEDFSIRQ